MRFPAYGRALFERRIAGERPRVVGLLVGNRWRRPHWLPADVPNLAVKPISWHKGARGRAEGFDWSVVRAMTVLAIDLRADQELEEGPDGWDSWLWLLAAVAAQARDVLMFTPTIEFRDPPRTLAMERDLGVYAFLGSTLDSASGDRRWPAWWPFGDLVHEGVA
jgi:hypothetical protein